MPKKLNLIKAQPESIKNQKAITQFFKTVNGDATEKISDKNGVHETKTNRKRKAIAPPNYENNDIKTLDTEMNLKKQKHHTSLDENKKIHTMVKEAQNSNQQTRNHLDNVKSCSKETLFQVDECKNIDYELENVNQRSPLSSVDNIDVGSLDTVISPKKRSPKKLEKNGDNINNENIQSPIKKTPQKSNKSDFSKQKTISPNKPLNVQNSGTPLCRSPRIASLRTPDKTDSELTPSKINKGKAKLALDFEENIDELFDNEDFNIDYVDENAADDLDLGVMRRCEVDSVEYNNTSMVIRVRDPDGRRATCFVEGIWKDTPISIGDVLSVMATRTADGRFSVSNTGGLLVFRPDHLISSTSVVGGVFCKRRAVLQDRFRGMDSGNNAMTVGIIIHELVQRALTQRIADPGRLRKETESLLKNSINMLYDAGLSIEEAYTSINTYIPPLVEFMQTYVLDKPPLLNGSKDRWHGHVDDILDIEENVCCPQLGLKGKIDATLQVTIHERQSRRKVTVPLELKSGRASGSAEHRGQLVLYGMMLARDPAAAQRGLLLYLKDKVDLREVSCGYPEKRDLIMLRNQLVQYLAVDSNRSESEELPDIEEAARLTRQDLPEPVHHHSACSKCPYLTLCSLYLWHTDGPRVSESHPLAELREEALGQLSPSHIQYFIHWTTLIKLEERGQMTTAPLHAIWTETPEKRARRGVCAPNLKLKSVEVSNDRFLHVLEYQNVTETGTNIKMTGPQVGEFAVVSIENRPWIAAGCVTLIQGGQLHILLERDLSRRHAPPARFHVDAYESYASTVQNLTNLGGLMEDNDRAHRLRRLLIDRDTPEFELKMNREVGRLGVKLMKSLNPEQQRAVFQALSAKDYILLQGLPGTGKTQTVTVLIQMLVALKQRVLVTAHTHSAVDTVLTRLPSSLRILRLGSASRAAPALAARCEQNMAAACNTPEELAQLYDSMEVVGVTCLGSAHALLAKTTFDVCIVDEATQVLQSTVLRPLMAAGRFVLVGDPEQLPPVVRSRHARRLGMEESLFSRLKDTGATVTLGLQYRMNGTLAALANRVAYQDRLRCATDGVKEATVALDIEKIKQRFNNPDSAWLHTACSSELDESALFLDTGVTSKGVNTKSSVNSVEALYVLAVVDALTYGGVEAKDIGIIAPYRDQVSLLRNSMVRLQGVHASEVSTVDQFQGRDKSVILYSCTRSDDADKKIREGEVLNDQRRLAVAVTRARHKLILIGDASTLRRYEPFRRFMEARAPLPVRSDVQQQLAIDYGTFIPENHG